MPLCVCLKFRSWAAGEEDGGTFFILHRQSCCKIEDHADYVSVPFCDFSKKEEERFS